MLVWCSTPCSGSWNEIEPLRIGWPCWIATTRRDENARNHARELYLQAERDYHHSNPTLDGQA